MKDEERQKYIDLALKDQVTYVEVRLYKLTNSVNPLLESAWFQPLNLKSEKQGFKVCFQVGHNWYRYVEALKEYRAGAAAKKLEAQAATARGKGGAMEQGGAGAMEADDDDPWSAGTAGTAAVQSPRCLHGQHA
jgi:hypothetical protein